MPLFLCLSMNFEPMPSAPSSNGLFVILRPGPLSSTFRCVPRYVLVRSMMAFQFLDPADQDWLPKDQDFWVLVTRPPRALEQSWLPGFARPNPGNQDLPADLYLPCNPSPRFEQCCLNHCTFASTDLRSDAFFPALHSMT